MKAIRKRGVAVRIHVRETNRPNPVLLYRALTLLVDPEYAALKKWDRNPSLYSKAEWADIEQQTAEIVARRELCPMTQETSDELEFMPGTSGEYAWSRESGQYCECDSFPDCEHESPRTSEKDLPKDARGNCFMCGEPIREGGLCPCDKS